MHSRLVTAEELLAMNGDGIRRELIDGEVRTMTPSGFRHGRIALEIARVLGNHVKSERLGVVTAAETGFRLEMGPDMVRAPDVAFVRAERQPGDDVVGFFDGAPDLAVEVTSPSDSFSDVEEKTQCWLAHGAAQVWNVDPATRRVMVHTPDGTVRDLGPDDTLDGGALLPGFSVKVAALFE